jgi:hypothetical protein
MLKSHADIIDLWPSQEALAAEIGQGAAAVRKWRQRRRIPSDYWLPLVAAAKRRGDGRFADLTVELLAELQPAPVRDIAEQRVTA